MHVWPRQIGAIFGVVKSLHTSSNEDFSLQFQSDKTSLGHAEAAAGAAALGSTVNILLGQRVQPIFHLRSTNPLFSQLAFGGSSLGAQSSIPRSAKDDPLSYGHFPRQKTMVAPGSHAHISSFAFSGTNTHTILRQGIVKNSKDHTFSDTRRLPWEVSSHWISVMTNLPLSSICLPPRSVLPEQAPLNLQSSGFVVELNAARMVSSDMSLKVRSWNCNYILADSKCL